FMFLIPLNIDGETTVPVAFLATFINDLITIEVITLLVVITVVIAAVLSIIYTWVLKIDTGFWASIFYTSSFWVTLRTIGAIFANFSRLVFTLPGRSTVDNLASWVGDGTVGVILTSKQYEDGFYLKREASVIASTFSVVSITFTIVILDLIGLMHLFGPFYLTIIVAGVIAALIMPRIPPLSRIEDTYYNDGSELEETIPEGHNPFSWGYHQAMLKAEKSPNLFSLAKE